MRIEMNTNLVLPNTNAMLRYFLAHMPARIEFNRYLCGISATQQQQQHHQQNVVEI